MPHADRLQVKGYRNDMTTAELKTLPFFRGENRSGMNGQAWLDLIAKSNQNKQIIVNFFDHQAVAPRDSSMYNAICEIRKAYPGTKIVTLTGNLHNRRINPFGGDLMLAGYLLRDSVNFNSDKIMSIQHRYNHGTMLNNIGNGLELHQIEPREDIFLKMISSNKFFCEKIFESDTFMTHFLYTEKVTHSPVIENS